MATAGAMVFRHCRCGLSFCLAFSTPCGEPMTPVSVIPPSHPASGQLAGQVAFVNNAGVAVAGNFETYALADFDRTVAVNVRGVFVATQAAVRHMGQGGAYGRVINMGSTNSDRVPWAGFSVYAMSKAAIVGLTKGLARDLGP